MAPITGEVETACILFNSNDAAAIEAARRMIPIDKFIGVEEIQYRDEPYSAFRVKGKREEIEPIAKLITEGSGIDKVLILSDEIQLS